MPEDRELFLIFIRPLNRLGVNYMVTGSTASMAYGIPHVTLAEDEWEAKLNGVLRE